MIEGIALALVLLGAWFWQDSMQTRQVAIAEGNRACAAEGFQFLDWSVALKKVTLKRDGDGRVRLQRLYDFEYSDTGNNRMPGNVAMLGRNVVSIYLSSTRVDRENVVQLH